MSKRHHHEMNWTFLAVILLLAEFGCGQAAEHRTQWPDRVFGLYAVPIPAFQEVSSSGFNVVHNYRFSTHPYQHADEYIREARNYLDAAQEYGLQVLLGIPRCWWLSGSNEPNLRTVIRQLSYHEALLAWYEEEAAQSGHLKEVLFLVNVVQTEDPKHGIILEEGRDIPELRNVGVARMFTYYPVSHKSRNDGRLSFVHQRFPVNGLNIPHVPALQAFGRDLVKGYPRKDLAAPNWRELQFTLYSALSSGAKGFFIYTYQHASRYDSEREAAGEWPYRDPEPLPTFSPEMWSNSKRSIREATVILDRITGASKSGDFRLRGNLEGVELAAWQLDGAFLVLISNSMYVSKPVILEAPGDSFSYQRLHHDRWSPPRREASKEAEIVVPGPGGVCLMIEMNHSTQ